MAAVLSLMMLVGCGNLKDKVVSWISTEEEDPRLADLKNLKPLLKVKRVWSAAVGGGSEEGHIKLRLLLQATPFLPVTATVPSLHFLHKAVKNYGVQATNKKLPSAQEGVATL